jgi:hypothetical protein
MIQCSACRQQDFEGALFCSNCGAPLGSKEKSPIVTGHLGAPEPTHEQQPAEPRSRDSEVFTARVSLKIVDNGQIIPLEGNQEYTLGRVSGNQPILPDIDLTPFQAYEGGVSRLHATIRVDPDKVDLNDLGSANGTRVNGKRMPAHSTQELVDGDTISLGKFRIQIVMRKSNT